MVMAKRNVSSGAADDLADEVLLERFTSRREEAAFAVLVRRYGRLVLGVCRRVLQHEQDAEDAFQAVFCVLARRAASIRQPGAIGAWLHAVAYRIARKAQARKGRSPVPADDLSDVPAAEESPEWVWRELRPILDEEVNRLPEKYRQAFVLCFLEGRTNEQAASQLGCPLGTILSRLARARERLRARLTRRGLVLSGGALAVALATEAAGVEVRQELTQTTLQAAADFMGRRMAPGTLSPRVSALAKGYLRSPSQPRRMRLAIALLVGLLGVVVIAIVLLLLLRRPLTALVRRGAPPPQTDEQRIQGTWRATRVQIGRVGDVPVGGIRLTFAGDQCTLTSDIGLNVVARFQIDANQTPLQITLHPQRGDVWPGIYLLEGNSLKICINQGGGPERPTTFTVDREGLFLYVLDREAAAP